jgi:hypothetical protein
VVERRRDVACGWLAGNLGQRFIVVFLASGVIVAEALVILLTKARVQGRSGDARTESPVADVVAMVFDAAAVHRRGRTDAAPGRPRAVITTGRFKAEGVRLTHLVSENSAPHRPARGDRRNAGCMVAAVALFCPADLRGDPAQ